ncbi:IS5 family transposase [Desulfobulbus oligotrophicus]|uniref:IS5 family transposase n=1 Tax=Desulfobulbus oligotrophicus TaxID=1909699 RepID=A0A7T5VF73_9BACT|nr:IS5 family transposase [Desulfobulbus oligotrophicus]QQG66647.1 IS5 family transposase [Desulfobulbus oligotrophicus]
MQPKKQISSPQLDMFRNRRESILNHRHELYQLSRLIDWGVFESEFGKLYSEEGRPGLPIRLLVGLTYLSHAFNTSDEETVRRWVENPYHQYFCGEEYFCHALPIDPSSLSRWRKRIGEQGSELILKLTVQAGLASGAVAPTSLARVIVDTTVQEKAIAFPTDSRLYNRSRERLIKLAAVWGIRLRQSYSRLGRQALLKAGRYFHARQTRRARREVKRLKTYLGRVYRDIVRKIEGQQALGPVFHPELMLAGRLLTQQKQDKNKLYSLHAPEVECIAKGKAHKKYEFGVKVSVATANRDNFVVGMLAEPGNPYDGHTLGRAIEQVQRITGCLVERSFVDRGYRGHNLKDPQVLISGRRQGMTPQMKKELKRRSAVEPVIGHMKTDGKLGRNYLLGTLGDTINALLCGAGHNIRLILKKLRERLFLLFTGLLLALWCRFDGQKKGAGAIVPAI